MRLNYRTPPLDRPVPIFGGVVIKTKGVVGNSIYYLFQEEFFIASPMVFGITIAFIHLHRLANQLRVGDLLGGVEIIEVTSI